MRDNHNASVALRWRRRVRRAVGPALGVVRQNEIDANLVVIYTVGGRLCRGVISPLRWLHRAAVCLHIGHLERLPALVWATSGALRRRWWIASGDAATGARSITRAVADDTTAGLALKSDGSVTEVVRNAVLGQKRLESCVLLLDSVALTSGLCIDVFEAKHLLLKRFDVHFFALSMSSAIVVSTWIAACGSVS